MKRRSLKTNVGARRRKTVARTPDENLDPIYAAIAAVQRAGLQLYAIGIAPDDTVTIHAMVPSCD
jgi:hypothetical protein